jgi:hypothetical protein
MVPKNDGARYGKEDAGSMSMSTTIKYRIDDAKDSAIVSERKYQLGRRHRKRYVQWANV